MTINYEQGGLYFIAEIGANHEGNLVRAVELIGLAAGAGAHAVKFQHYRAETLASESGFEQLADLAHYSDNPFRVFRRFEVPWDWTPILADVCNSYRVDFMSTPYDLESVDHLAPYVAAFKIGSGDITYTQLIRRARQHGKPLIVSTGASDTREVIRAVQSSGEKLCLMQCNTNYTGDDENYAHLNLRVLQTYEEIFPHARLGFSDHTRGHAAVLGAITLGATVIEKHFTDDSRRSGSPDHPFATEPHQWSEMVAEAGKLYTALGSAGKSLAANETETVVLQRRCLRAARDLPAGHVVTEADVVALRPAPGGSLPPYLLNTVIGRTVQAPVGKHECF